MATITKEISDNGAISAYGTARSTVKGAPLSPEELDKIDAYWRASLYLCVGMLYLKDNPLLREPLKLEQTKPRLLGHWGSDAGQSFTYIHFNRLINKYDLNAIYISGPGHGAPAVLSNAYLEGRSEEHTSELQSRQYLVCRLLLEKKKRAECQRATAPTSRGRSTRIADVVRGADNYHRYSWHQTAHMNTSSVERFVASTGASQPE